MLYNYLENNNFIPWVDLRYMFGQIMYGGHITDNLDRRLCDTYLSVFVTPQLMDGDLEYAPGFPQPPSGEFQDYHNYMDEFLPPESPYLYGMHPNTEITFLTNASSHLFTTVLSMQPRKAGGGGGNAGPTREEKLMEQMNDMAEKVPELYSLLEMNARVEELTPYIIVSLQEAERHNRLINVMSKGLKEAILGLKGELTVTAAMENLCDALFLNQVPRNWEPIAYPSSKDLAVWYLDYQERYKQIEAWTGDFALPSVVWLGGFFNPQAFLVAIQQTTARKNEWPLDKMTLQCDVTKKYNPGDFSSPPREGSYVSGVFMEGARWDTGSGLIQESRLKELIPPMPVLFIKAITVDKADPKGQYHCPLFKTRDRARAREAVAVGCAPGFVYSLYLKTKVDPRKWVIAGVVMSLSD